MKTRSVYPVLLALFTIGSVVSQNADELPVHVETDNQFPPEHSELDGQNEGSETTATDPAELTSVTTTAEVTEYNTNEEQVKDESMVEVSTEPSLSVVDDAATTNPDPLALGSTTPDVVGTTLTANEVISKESENIAMESTQEMSTKKDVAAPELANYVSNIEDSETVAETTAAETAPLSETTAAVIAAPAAHANDDFINNEGSETTVAEISAAESAPTSQSTTADIAPPALVNDDISIIKKDGETTAAETVITKTTLTSAPTTADVAAPVLGNDDFTNNEGGETTVPETTLSESTTADEAAQAVANNEGSETTAAESTVVDITAAETTVTDTTAAETTAAETTLTSGSTTVDGTAPVLGNADVTNNEGDQTTAAETLASETTAAETTSTSGSTIADVAAPTLTTQDEQETTYEDSKTTVEERSETTSGLTIANVVAPTLATKGDDITNVEASETTLVDPTEAACPKPCVCITEGDSTNYVVDCSGHGLTEIPTQIDPKTTTLKLHDNKLTTIPKSISELKNLKVLDANDNLITDLESGSISELPELVSLKLANNHFLEYPKDLENSGTWNKLEELDLAGNELKTTLEIFLNYKALRTVTLPEVSPVLVSQLCTSLKDTLLTVCIQSCKEHSFKCSDASAHMKDDSLEATLPGMIPFNPEISMLDLDASVKPFDPWIEKTAPQTLPETKLTPDSMPVPDISSKSRRIESAQVPPEVQHPETSSGSKDSLPVNDFSLRNAVYNAPQEKVALDNKVIDTPKEPNYNETDVKVGAKTIDTKGGGGVDKSVIAVIVAGMVIVIAVITVKKNWSSITNRFSSTPRPNERSGNANGTTPEEVPLQDKSPV